MENNKDSQLKLFDLPKDDAPINTCNTCENRQRWQCGERIIQYCGVRKSNRTENGLLKIKCKDPACDFYKQQNKEQ
jgi:hypothetical protein